MSQSKMSGREKALERRKAMSSSGKRAVGESNPGRGRGRAKPEPVKVERGARSEAKPAAAPASDWSASTQSAAKPAARRTARPVTNNSATRNAALERRKAMSSRGKPAASSGDRTRTAEEVKAAQIKPTVEAVKAEIKNGTCDCGCQGETRGEKRVAPSRAAGRTKAAPRKNLMPAGRAQSLARRQAMSSRGKAGLSGKPMSAAQTARVTNPELSGRDLAKALREQRSKRGGAGETQSRPTGKVRPKVDTSAAAASDQPWKVGASETAQGQTVTGTMVNRSQKTTGNEAATCRSVTGTEYMGSEVFQNFCETAPTPTTPAKVRKTSTFSGNAVTGNEVGRSTKVTGNEPGTCKNVTGTEYVSTEQEHAFCANVPTPGPAKVTGSQTRRGETITGAQTGLSSKVTGNEPGAGRTLTGSQYLESDAAETTSKVTRSGGKGGQSRQAPSKVPAKVGTSDTLRGGSVTGSMVGRRENMTGDEAGSCRNITGDDYVGQEQFNNFCQSTPKPTDNKVGVSATLKGERITGTQTGRASRVTGDEPGTCKSVTGTPYAGLEQFAEYCEPRQMAGARARVARPERSGAPMTGLQPGIGGKLTGADKGACENLTGTPYIGADQTAETCSSNFAEPGSADFPQPLDSSAGAAPSVPAAGTESWGDFSVNAPRHAAKEAEGFAGVTGGPAAGSERITGPFGMAPGKVTGTEEARFPRQPAPAPVEEPQAIAGRAKPRISGEGMETGSRITGDDWGRNERVTGTEGTSSLARNPTRRGNNSSVMPMKSAATAQRPEDVPTPVSRVTGASGNTENGSLITYSGGARG